AMPLVQAVLDTFPGARIAAVREIEPEAGGGGFDAATAALPAIDDDGAGGAWDPFEDE
ncbi:MAG: hypothetical protein H5U24_18900, partial [Thioclava marina]|nr:hypothetical protein [Thioclava marina]